MQFCTESGTDFWLTRKCIPPSPYHAPGTCSSVKNQSRAPVVSVSTAVPAVTAELAYILAYNIVYYYLKVQPSKSLSASCSRASCSFWSRLACQASDRSITLPAHSSDRGRLFSLGAKVHICSQHTCQAFWRTPLSTCTCPVPIPTSRRAADALFYYKPCSVENSSMSPLLNLPTSFRSVWLQLAELSGASGLVLAQLLLNK